MNLLITGACGFVGSHFLKYVLQQRQVKSVVSLDALTYAGTLNNIEPAEVRRHPKHDFVQMNIRDGGGVAGVLRRNRITHVVHLAAETHVDRSIIGPGNFVNTNVLGTFNLLEAIREANWPFERFLHVSTDEVYGTVSTGSCDEYCPLQPSSPYSASKAASEMMVMGHHTTYGIPALITRCSNNYGTHQYPEKLIPVVIASILNGRSIPIYGDGTNVRDWIHVADHVRALWLVLTQGNIGQVYNISSGELLSNLEIVHMICDIIDGGASRKLITFVKDRMGHDRRYAPDSSKLRRETGWTCLESLPNGLAHTVRWYMKR